MSQDNNNNNNNNNDSNEDKVATASELIFQRVFAQNQQEEPGAPANNDNNNNDNNNDTNDQDATPNDKDAELERMKKILAEKEAEIAAMKEKLQKKEDEVAPSAEGSTNDIDNNNHTMDDGESKMPPKSDIVLSVKGTAEYDSYPFSLSADRFYFMASIKAPYFRSEQRAAIDLVAVVDESGSMNGDPIRLVKETVCFMIKNLEASDRFGIVGYSNCSRIVLPLTKMDQYGRDHALQSANSLVAKGGTALCAGLLAGVNMIRDRKDGNEVASVMILTDGQANSGPRTATEINQAVLTGSMANVKSSGRSIPSYGLVRNRNRMHMRRKPVAKSPLPPPLVPEEKKEEEKEKEKEKEANTTEGFEAEKELPCTINTFGFGSNHNESLLEAIAENGRGMYAFIDTTEMISETFAECLGGLVSIIAQDLKVTVEALQDVEINRCMSIADGVKVLEANKKYQITIKDLQSEENRDLLFDLKLNALDGIRMDEPFVKLSAKYKNVVKEVDEELVHVCNISRIPGKDIGERNMQLDIQYNRVCAADAMEKADDMAKKGDLSGARKLLQQTQEQISKSKSRENKFTTSLVTDIQRVSDNMQSKAAFASRGGKMLKMNKKAHRMQRSVQSAAYTSHGAYANRSKMAMRTKFSK